LSRGTVAPSAGWVSAGADALGPGVVSAFGVSAGAGVAMIAAGSCVTGWVSGFTGWACAALGDGGSCFPAWPREPKAAA